MSYKIIDMWVPESKYGIKCPYKMTPTSITVHNTANDASARSEVEYMRNNSNQVSFHVAIDDREAVQAIPFNRNAWHAGDGVGPGNTSSISIEICYSKSGGSRFDEAEKNAAAYVAGVLEQYGWGIDKVKKHQDWSGKYCPHRTLDKAMAWDRVTLPASALKSATPNLAEPALMKQRKTLRLMWPECWSSTDGGSIR